MYQLDNYDEPFEAVEDFEFMLGEYTGAPYVVATDCCTHAIELALRTTWNGKDVGLPARTYLSVPMTMHKLGIRYWFLGLQWRGEYQIVNTSIWDSARRLERGMYRPGEIQCLSFGYSKPLEIGRGGAILLDDGELFFKLKAMSYDGRILTHKPWETQQEFSIGFHYRMLPEEALIGMTKLAREDFNQNQDHEYPDLRKIKICERPWWPPMDSVRQENKDQDVGC